MIHALLVVLVLVALALLIVAGLALRRLTAALPGPALVSSTVVVQTRDDRTLRGVLVAEHADRIHLEDAVWVDSETQQSKVGGLAIVPRDNISWLQLVTATTPAE